MEETEARPVHQLIYASAATRDFTDEALAALLDVARRRNEAVDVTGMLLYEDRSFLQVLEGDREAVERLYARIAEDPRHTDSIVLSRTDREEREFGSWRMAWARPPDKARELLPGWDQFLSGGFRGGTRNEAALAQKLLYAFRDEGRYRR